MLRIRNLESGYGKLRVLKRISLHVDPGEIVTIIGANGAGKSTLLKSIAGLVRATSGTIDFQGQSLLGKRPEKIVALGCSMVPERRQVFAPMTVHENLLLGGYVRSRRDPASSARDLRAAYERFPVLKQRGSQLAGTLSGGEQQMLAMARALMARPRMIMLDEPSTGLAPLVIRDIFEIVVALRESGNTVLLVEQNAKAALRVADRGYVLETGKIMLQGPSEELLANRDVQRAYLGREAGTGEG